MKDANLHEKMLAITGSIGWVEKHGRNDFHGYNYVRAEDIKAIVQKGCVANGVAFYTSVDEVRTEIIGSDGKKAVLAIATGSFTFVNATNPDERHVTRWAGQGVDSADKAVAKAVTNGVKYGLLNTFMVPTGDDPDGSSETLPGGEVEVRREAPRQYADDAPRTHSDAGRCPKHDKPWTAGKYGPYCTAKDQSTERGYCALRPPRESALEVAGRAGGGDDFDDVPF